MATLAPTPSALTVMVGLPAEADSIRMLDEFPASSTTQLPGDETSVSPKRRLPMVRGESRRTRRSSTSSRVAKSAVFPTPAPMIPLNQLGFVFHKPPETL